MERSQSSPRVRSRTRRTQILLLLAIVTTALLAASGLLTTAGEAQTSEPFLETGPVVVLSDRPVCSLLGNSKMRAGIVGTDGSETVQIGDTVYWTFGDTVLDNGWMIPNAIAWSTDTNASDCIDLTPKQNNGRAVPLLGLPNPGKLTVWPMGMAETAPGLVHFYYASVVPDATLGWRPIGTGIASFDTTTLTGTPALGGSIVWGEGSPGPSRTLTDNTYVYLLLDASRATWTTDTILARVPTQSFASPGAYEYWDAGGPGRPSGWIGGLWNAASGSWDPAINDLPPLWRQLGMHNGVDIAYNEFLGKWLAVYSTAFMTSLNARVADDLTGPWNTQQAVLVDCLDFHHVPSQQAPFVCYSGTQHESYARDGGRTIYVTYSNSETYQVYLHEIRFAAAIEQWSDEAGHASYLPRGGEGPAGSTVDGVAFHASDIPVPGFTAIHRWEQAGTDVVEYGAIEPDAGYVDAGVAFYAPLTLAATQASNVTYAPVYRWSSENAIRYSPLNLGPAGYTQGQAMFYAPCPDSDADGLMDCDESLLGTNPGSADTDGDGLADAFEHAQAGCDPRVFNEDDLDGVSAGDEAAGGKTSPCIWDTGSFGCSYGAWRHPLCDVDSDADGCRDAFELGPDARKGGRRNPANPWDFYDPNGDGVVSVRDDILAVAMAFGSSTRPSYSTRKDRSPPPSAAVEPDPTKREPWDTGPPDGAITAGGDVLIIGRQFGYTCRPLK